MDEEKYECLKLDHQLCFPLYVCAKEIVRRYKPFLDEIGLTYTQYITMMVLWERKELSVKELGEYLYLDSGTLTPVLKTLEQKGYVNRTRSKQDERNLLVTLTPVGEALKEKAVTIPHRMMNCLEVEPETAAKLYELLTKVMASWK